MNAYYRDIVDRVELKMLCPDWTIAGYSIWGSTTRYNFAHAPKAMVQNAYSHGPAQLDPGLQRRKVLDAHKVVPVFVLDACLSPGAVSKQVDSDGSRTRPYTALRAKAVMPAWIRLLSVMTGCGVVCMEGAMSGDNIRQFSNEPWFWLVPPLTEQDEACMLSSLISNDQSVTLRIMLPPEQASERSQSFATNDSLFAGGPTCARKDAALFCSE
ncbi:hypothetical protein EV715DRAFT_293945 [Schizophyllum commune]